MNASTQQLASERRGRTGLFHHGGMSLRRIKTEGEITG